MVRARLPGFFGSSTRSQAAARAGLEEREQTRKIGYLSTIDIFRDMTPDDLAALDRMTRMNTVQRGQILYAPGETGEMLFLLKRGRVQLYKLSVDGRKLILATLGPETFFGDMSLLGQQMASAFAEAVEDSTVCLMTRDDVEALLLRKPQVALRLLEAMGRRLLETEGRLEDVAFKRVPARVAGLLLRLAEGESGGEVHQSHQELAETLGVYRETVTNALDRLKEAGAIEIGRRRIRVRNEQLLRQMAEE